jgi:hypothetical protein
MGMGMGMGMGAEADSAAQSAAAAAAALMDGEGSAVLAPASAAARRAVRESIAQSWSWAEALPALMQHWRDHGVDDVAAHSVLTWSLKAGLKGKVSVADEKASAGAAGAALGEAWAATPLPGTEEVAAAVSNSMKVHAAVSSSITPQHVLVHGAPGGGKRWLLRAAAGANFSAGLRCVVVSRTDLRNLPELLQSIRAHPRVRFVVLLEMPLSLAPYAEVGGCTS